MAHMKEKLRYFWTDPNRKPLWKIAYELTETAWNGRELPVHYLSRCLYRKQVNNPLDYCGNRRIDRLHSAVNPVHDIPMLVDKLFFQLLFEKAGLHLPRMLGYSCRTIFHGRTTLNISSITSFLEMLRYVIDESSNGIVFVKPRTGAHGAGIYKITVAKLAETEAIECMHRDMLTGSYIFQEALQQHPAINCIYPHSINTIRMDTFVHDDGHVEPLSAYMRFGGNGSHVDNISQGGCFVGVDFEKGCLRSEGHRLLEYGGETCKTHPATGYRFEGFEIPFFREAKSLVTRAALVTAANRLVGWDIAILADGPSLIEGNHIYHKGIQEMVYGGYQRHPTFAQILDKFSPL